MSQLKPKIVVSRSDGANWTRKGLRAFLEYRDSSFRTQQDVTSVLSLPVLAQIPLIVTPAEYRELARRRLAMTAAAAVLTSVVGIVLWRMGILSGLLRWI